MNIEVIQEEKAFILYVDKAPAGRIDYQDHGGERFLIHTEIDPEFSGQGLARTLVEKVLEQNTLPIVAICPYVSKYIRTQEHSVDWRKPTVEELSNIREQ